MANISESNNTTEWMTGALKKDTFNIIVNFIVLFVGVPGNCLIIRVYRAKTIKKSTHVLIMSLAWADLFTCILSVPVIVTYILRLAVIEINNWFHFFLLIRRIIITSALLLTGVIAADRYDCVCRPQKRFFSVRRAKIAAWTSFMLATMWNLPAIIGLYFKTSMIRYNITPIFGMICFLSSLLTITLSYGKVYTVIQKHVRASQSLSGVKSASTPSCSFKRCESSTSTPGTGKDINCADSSDEVSYSHHHHAVKLNTPNSPSRGPQSETFQERSADKSPTSQVKVDSRPVTTSETGADTKGSYKPKLDPLLSRSRSHPGHHSVALQRKTTKMLFITSLVFLLLWLPYMIWNAMYLAYSGSSNISPKVLAVMESIRPTLLLNSVVNPFIYGIANRRFRKDCRLEIQKIKLC